ncbi:MAG: Cof-type HAD-IIB family hydrolase [Lachnospiraceae bacterium]|nr:Cof-type HAD-IIB family hydrolase [Lachnospiraceae bacterium]
MTTRILFTDLDGTLLDHDKNISPGNLGAIDQLIKAGHKFVIATGRPIQSAIKIARRYNWTGDGYYLASYNGGLIYDCSRNEAIVKYPVRREYVRHILDEAYKSGLHAHTYDDINVVSERDNEELRQYTKAIAVPAVIVPDAVSYLKEDPIKVIVISAASHEVLDSFREHMLPWCSGKLTTVFSHPTLLEFAHPKATKGLAVKFMCGHFGIPLKDSVAAGDEENDITMIEAAGIGAAMSNASGITKAAADYVTENDNDHDGIAEIINKFIL